MKTLKYVILLFVLFVFPGLSYSGELGDLRISLIDGDIQIKTEDTGDWVSASINMPLQEGDRIWVPEGGKTELQLRDGTCLRLAGETGLELLTLDNNSVQTYLNEGRVYVNFKGRKSTLLQMDTPLASIRSYQHSIFTVDVSADGMNKLSVLKGSIDAEGQGGKTTVAAGYILSLNKENYAETSPLGAPDKWEDWNRARDKRIAGWRPPSRYLPEELYPYSDDLDENGRWVHDSEYGYVWTPNVVLSVGWAPYRIGRWMWVHGDYVWISHEHWGWAPYHYGRWAFSVSIGWCWVPPVRGSVFWGPGFVGWIHTPTYVAWVPLGPRDTYYGRGHYGHNSVNITNVNITNINVDKTTYRNVHVRDSVTVVRNDDFVKGKQRFEKIRDNPFMKEKISVGSPKIRPDKDSNMPVVRENNHRRKPPESIQNVKVSELKSDRPLVRKREASVLRPESPQNEMKVKVNEGMPVERNWRKTDTSRTRSQDAKKKTVEKIQKNTGIGDSKSTNKTDEKIKYPQSGKERKQGRESRQPAGINKEPVSDDDEIQETGNNLKPEKRRKNKRENRRNEKTIDKTGDEDREIQEPVVTIPQEKSREDNQGFKREQETVKESGPEYRGQEDPEITEPPEKVNENKRENRRQKKIIDQTEPENGGMQEPEVTMPPEKSREQNSEYKRDGHFRKDSDPVYKGTREPRITEPTEQDMKTREPKRSRGKGDRSSWQKGSWKRNMKDS